MRRIGRYAALAVVLPLIVTTAASARRKERWVSLFDGKDLNGWHLRDEAAHSGWKVEHGLLVNTPPSTDLVSGQIPLSVISLAPVFAQVQAGKLMVLAMLTATR